jgi:hypothetical protein
MSNDHLYPSCARSIRANIVPNLGSESPWNIRSSSSTDVSSFIDSTNHLLLLANNKEDNSLVVQQQNNIVGATSRKMKQQQLKFHALPPAVNVMNESAVDGAKCQFSKQSNCK